MVYFVRNEKKLLTIMISVIVGIYLLRAGIYYNKIFSANHQILIDINKFFGETRFDNMAIGGLLALFYTKYPNIKINVLYRILIYTLFAIITFFTPTIGYGLDMIFASLVFAGLMLDIVTSSQSYFLDNPVFKFLGKISYGIYMYHVIGIYTAINLLLFFFPHYTGHELSLNIILYVFAIMGSILISAISYYLFESKFLRIKEKLSALNGLR